MVAIWPSRQIRHWFRFSPRRLLDVSDHFELLFSVRFMAELLIALTKLFTSALETGLSLSSWHF